jgi:S-adenosyl methyltransferase
MTRRTTGQALGSAEAARDRGHRGAVVQRVRLPDAHVIYVDNDPVVVAHGRALLTGSDSVTVVEADVRGPDSILGDPDVARLIDFAQPVAVL